MKDAYNNATGAELRTPKQNSKLVPLLAFVSVLAGLQTATQSFAYQFDYQAILGVSINHIYPPWNILLWVSIYHAKHYGEIVQAASMGVVAAGFGLLIVAVTKSVLTNTNKANKSLHGSARWANIDDIRAAGLLPPKQSWFAKMRGKPAPINDGVYVGSWVDASGQQHYLRDNSNTHILTYAPTRSGKGVGLVTTSLLTWPHSAVITDLKGELWALTAGWRQKHAKNKVLRFEPAASIGCARWNPLDEIRIETENEVGDVQNLATLIVDPDGKGLESHWQKTSQALLVGVILHSLYKSKREQTAASMSSVDATLADPDRDISELWAEMMTYPHVNGKPHPVIASSARDMTDRPEEEAGSVLSTVKSYLALYRDPIVRANTEVSDFKIKDLMYLDDPVSLYIVTQPNDKARLRPLVRIMVNMIIRLLADKMDFKNGRPVAHYKHRLLVMLDEFPSLGKLEILQESLAFVAGYGLKCYLICQDINQLKSRETGYGADETITSNCHIQNAYPPNRIETAEHLSKLTGTTTVIKEQITTSGKRMSAMLTQVSRTTQETQRPLLTPDECLRMQGAKKSAEGDIIEAGDMVVYVAGYPAILGKQPLYFKDPIFLKRASVEAPVRSDTLRKVNPPMVKRVSADQL